MSTSSALAIATLTPRQRDVLDGFLAGLSHKEIGWKIGIDVSTVQEHKRTIMKKLQAPHNIELVKVSLRAGVITL